MSQKNRFLICQIGGFSLLHY